MRLGLHGAGGVPLLGHLQGWHLGVPRAILSSKWLSTRSGKMPRVPSKPDDLETIAARRAALVAELASVDEQLKAAQVAARDAGRPILLAALERIKVAAMDKNDAKAIANAIGQHGGAAVARHLASLGSA